MQETHKKIRNFGKNCLNCIFTNARKCVLPIRILAIWLATKKQGIANEPKLAIILATPSLYRGSSQIANGQFFPSWFFVIHKKKGGDKMKIEKINQKFSEWMDKNKIKNNNCKGG